MPSRPIGMLTLVGGRFEVCSRSVRVGGNPSDVATFSARSWSVGLDLSRRRANAAEAKPIGTVIAGGDDRTTVYCGESCERTVDSESCGRARGREQVPDPHCLVF